MRIIHIEKPISVGYPGTTVIQITKVEHFSGKSTVRELVFIAPEDGVAGSGRGLHAGIRY